MSDIYVKFFIYAALVYFLVLNLTLVLIIEPKFTTKYYGHHPLYQKFKSTLSALFLIGLFVASFFLGMFAFLMKIFNTMIIL